MSVNLAIDIEPNWTARIEIKQGGVTMRRNVEVPALDAETAKERMVAALQFVWKPEQITFLSQPVLKGGGK